MAKDNVIVKLEVEYCVKFLWISSRSNNLYVRECKIVEFPQQKHSP